MLLSEWLERFASGNASYELIFERYPEEDGSRMLYIVRGGLWFRDFETLYHGSDIVPWLAMVYFFAHSKHYRLMEIYKEVDYRYDRGDRYGLLKEAVVFHGPLLVDPKPAGVWRRFVMEAEHLSPNLPWASWHNVSSLFE